MTLRRQPRRYPRLVRVLGGLGRLLLGTLLAGALVAGLLLPYSVGLGMASNEVALAIENAKSDTLDEPLPLRATLTDAAGTPIAYSYEQNRVQVPLSAISNYLQKAVIAMEDRRYFNHRGFDIRGTVRALLRNAQSDQAAQGGSTLTQQYVKNYLYLVQAKTEAEKADAIATTPIRKLREAKMAINLEQNYSKDDILERYLNLVAFAPSVYGAEASSQYFFGVSADKLTLAQAALLAGMVNNPNKYNPLRPDSADVAKERRDLVLDVMAQTGWVSEATAEATKREGLGVVQNVTPNGCVAAIDSATNGFFCQYALDYLANAGLDAKTVARSGWTIKTTLDPGVMKAAKDAAVANADPNVAEVNRVANVVSVVGKGEPRKVLALAANRPFGLDPDQGQTVQRLTTTFAPLGAGSTFKVFTAAAAMEAGLGTNAQLNVPDTYTSPLVPANEFGNAIDFANEMTLAQALAESPNTAFVALEDQIGLDKVADMSVRLGLRGYALDAGDVDQAFAGAGTDYAAQVVAQKIASFTLGVSPVSPLELASVGGTIISDGKWCPPTPVDTITDRDGRLVTWTQLPCEQVIPVELARTLAVAMEGDFTNERGTAFDAARANEFSAPAAGKTGTTQDYKSSAFLGFTPQMSASVLVWDYLPRPQSICKDPLRSCSGEEAEEPGKGMSGGSVPLSTWLGVMKPLQGEQSPLFPPASPAYIRGSVQTQVPSVIGLDVEEAKARLAAAGFSEVQVTPVVNAGSRANIVVEQNPRNTALPTSKINLNVSAGASTGGG